MSAIRSIALSVTTLTAALGLAACSSAGGTGTAASSPAPASSAPLTSSVAVSSSAPQTSSAPTSSAPPSSAPATSASQNSGATSRCAESQLRASVATQNVPGTGRHVVRLNFLNKSGSTCTLTGYPGAAIEDSSGKQVQQAKRVVGGVIGGTIEKQSGTVTLRPGTTAYAYLEGASTREVGAAQAGCDGPKYPRILVTPPNTSTPVPFTIGWPQCYAFDVHPVRKDT